MNAMDRVANVLLGHRGNTYCNSCVEASVAFEDRQDVQQSRVHLPFLRSFSTCSMCGREWIVMASN